ncbi:amidophosphoribosyltransferase [Brevifollis gellanilyticus]|uniref:Amidophosphoribosyltransferase n=1 Tax=Brevifollis gellanilyticus TaxID=748831 RepID=A0A512M7V5_9BACT|nr:amidophosphoribosyltransferase [Brevifollis gellanilyticus]GEP42817.1 amidophosphoribosyltransferase [Brevifollis gellanilyticus]
MSDPIRHECGLAVVRLKKSLAYYQEHYGTALYGFNLLAALMAKQRNRGQDGIGIGCCKLDMPAGTPYLFRERFDVSVEQMGEVFSGIRKDYKRIARKIDGQRREERHETGVEHLPFEEDPEAIKREFELAGEINIGHLRYGTSGGLGKACLHPYLRRTTWPTRSLMVMGNFNLTNSGELNRVMMQRGQHPVFGTDTQSVLEEIGFQLDEAHTQLYHELRDSGMPGTEIPKHISARLDVGEMIRKSAQIWDGGYAIVGVIGSGDLFVMRDPNGIRPCWYYENDEILAFASERVALMSVLEVPEEDVKELPPAHVAVMKSCGTFTTEKFTEVSEPKPCSFERIYFSRGNDSEIYKQRKRLGEQLVEQVVEAIDNDFEHTVLSFIPNTAETAYFGFLDGLRKSRRVAVKEALMEMLKKGELDEAKLDDLVLRNWPRAEKIAHKDIKMRTFIASDAGRDELVSSVYDITYGSVTEKDNLVVIDDSIVRGTTLKTSLLRILARTNPKRILVLSTAPQIRYPDCYGIDMSELGKFIAFQAAVELLKERNMRHVLRETHEACLAELKKPRHEMRNAVKAIYAPFTDEEISAKVAQLVSPAKTPWKGKVEVIFQTIPGLHAALDIAGGPSFGDWYFSGDYPTPGGFGTVNRAFINFYEKKEGRSYDTLL